MPNVVYGNYAVNRLSMLYIDGTNANLDCGGLPLLAFLSEVVHTLQYLRLSVFLKKWASALVDVSSSGLSVDVDGSGCSSSDADAPGCKGV